MRLFRLKYQNAKEAVYEYLVDSTSDSKLPYTGIVKINKATRLPKIIKEAANEWSKDRAAFSAVALTREKYPNGDHYIGKNHDGERLIFKPGKH